MIRSPIRERRREISPNYAWFKQDHPQRNENLYKQCHKYGMEAPVRPSIHKIFLTPTLCVDEGRAFCIILPRGDDGQYEIEVLGSNGVALGFIICFTNHQLEIYGTKQLCSGRIASEQEI